MKGSDWPVVNDVQLMLVTLSSLENLYIRRVPYFLPLTSPFFFFLAMLGS